MVYSFLESHLAILSLTQHIRITYDVDKESIVQCTIFRNIRQTILGAVQVSCDQGRGRGGSMATDQT